MDCRCERKIYPDYVAVFDDGTKPRIVGAQYLLPGVAGLPVVDIRGVNVEGFEPAALLCPTRPISEISNLDPTAVRLPA